MSNEQEVMNNGNEGGVALHSFISLEDFKALLGSLAQASS
jgi:hypothetical protein